MTPLSLCRSHMFCYWSRYTEAGRFCGASHTTINITHWACHNLLGWALWTLQLQDTWAATRSC